MSLTLAQGTTPIQAWYNATAIQNLTAWSCCGWFYYNGSGGSSPCTLFDACSTTNGGGYILGAVLNVGTGVLSFYNSGSYLDIRSGVVRNNTPFFLGLVVNGSNWYSYQRYYDESSFTTTTNTHGAPVNQPMLSFNFGDHNGNSLTWSGKMDKLKLWNGVVPSAQMYNESLFRSPTVNWSLLGWWPLDDSAVVATAMTNKAGNTFALTNLSGAETVDTSQLVTQTNWVIPN